MKSSSLLQSTLLLATSFGWAQAPDVILYNGKIFTSNPERLWAEALSIRGERISAVGTSDSIRPWTSARSC